MHELSVALSLLDVAAEAADRQGAGCVAAIHLRLGPLSGVVKEALCSAYDLAREGTAMAKTELIIEDVPLMAYCPACKAERAPPSPEALCCPDCGTPMPEILRGRELDVFALEIEP
jgi:hydrogenase nickel incorporation protein HypA/HybF